MRVVELTALSDSQVADLRALMGGLDAEVPVTEEMLRRAAAAPGTHLFAAFAGERLVGCASLCLFDSPTGRKASVEDVVVEEGFRGQGIGRVLMEHLIDYARREWAPIDLHLTSRPSRVAANGLYRSLGFQLRNTNAYRLALAKES